jgi:hypothetical protein
VPLVRALLAISSTFGFSAADRGEAEGLLELVGQYRGQCVASVKPAQPET